jgi:hypothetical protein
MAIVRRNNKDYVIKNVKGKVKYAHECEHCGTDFLSSRTTAKYCSDTCKQSAYRYRLILYCN